MSGHSKWATIHRQKEVNDQKRGQIFTKISNAISLAVREGGNVADPEHNFKLRLAIEKAKAVNMPKENIQRAIDRVIGRGEGINFVEILYEGYGPGGVGILVEAMTDNKQRTVQEVKNVFDRHGGSLASPGAVAFNFVKTGLLVVETVENKDEIILQLIDLGAEEVEEREANQLEVYVPAESLEDFKEKVSHAGLTVKSVEMVMKPKNLIEITDPQVATQVMTLMEKLEDLDDIQKVYANCQIPEEVINAN